MVPMLFRVLIYGTIAGSATIFGVLSVIYVESWARRHHSSLIALAAGVLLGAAFLRLIPQSMEHAEGGLVLVLVGILAFYVIENRMVLHICDEEGCPVHGLGLIALIGIGFHSLIDGIAIGTGFRVGEVVGAVTSIAVILHEYPEGIITYSLLLTEGNRRTAVVSSILVALATPLGALGAYWILPFLSEQVLGYLLALAAGSFIYIGAADLIPKTHESRAGLNAGLVVSGVVLTHLVGALVQHAH